ncbi:MAG: hypothetical protein IJB83_02980 [Bacilli bacterium]|nr:hypothetical protein [Bacilli bacterium]
MNKKILIGIVISVLLLGVIGLSYSFFSVSVTGEGRQNTVTAGTLELQYIDGNGVSLPRAYPGQSVTKVVSVKNIGTLDTEYDLLYKDLINEITKDELVVSYTCTSYKDYVSSTNKGQVSGTCNSLSNQVVPYSISATDSVITSKISIASSITHEYTFTFTFKEMNNNQDYNQGKRFSTKINIVEYKPKWYDLCTASSNNLNCKIITAQIPSSDVTIDFGQISSATNGNGLYYTSNLSLTEDYNQDGIGDRVYYYRGTVTNNNVRFGGYCWRIVRTNEDGSVRLRYNGEYSNGTCPVTGTEVKINNSDYNFYGSYNNEKYNEYIWEDGTGKSNAKTIIDAWYISSGLSNYEDQIANVPYCADKSNPTTGYKNYTFYGAANRLADITYTNSTYAPKGEVNPTYKCADVEDKHTVAGDSWGGNGKLSKPIGLLTADEVAFAGGRYYQSGGSSNNTSYYLFTSSDYWLISPFYWDGSYAGSFIVNFLGTLDYSYVNTTLLGLVPAVSLKAETMVNAQGDGTYTNPYVVE